MDSRDKPTGQRHWVLALFGLPFAGAGLAVLWFLVISTLVEWQGIRQWEPVPAQVLAAELAVNRDSDGNTYRAAARYRYEYGGSTYESERVAVQDMSDNIGSFQQDLAAQLQQAAASGEPYTVYVNPQAPQEAVANRELRGGQLIMLAVFGAIFAAVGLGFVAFGLRRRDGGDTGSADAAAPWRARSEWNSPEIRSRAGGVVVFAWLFAVFWCAISGVATFFAIDEFLAEGNKAALFVLLFDVVGLGLLAWAIQATISARKFGELLLRLDPHPGSIGGDVGGMVDLPLPHDPARAVTMTLSCLHVYTRRSGKNRETRRDPVWSDSRHFLAEPTADGKSRVHFRFAVPAGLPVSAPPDSDYHEWVIALECALPGVDLSRNFTIPVFATATATRVAPRVRESQAESLAHLEQLMNLEQSGDGIFLDYRAGRHWRGGLALAAFGSVFAAVPLLVWFAGDEMPAVAKFLFGGLFGLVGVACVAGGIWMAANRLRVSIDGSEGRVRRELFGFNLRERAVPRAELAGIVAVRGATMSSGSKTTVYYGLALKTLGGELLAIGDGFRGYGEAGRAAGVIGTYTRLPFLGEQDAGAAFAARKQAWLDRDKR